jgi:hypothetical protein
VLVLAVVEVDGVDREEAEVVVVEVAVAGDEAVDAVSRRRLSVWGTGKGHIIMAGKFRR